jgi:hypothetical protein
MFVIKETLIPYHDVYFYNFASILIIMRKLIRFITRFILYIFIVIAGMLIMYYLMAPVYNFSGPVPFIGNKLYNPYKDIDSSNWKKYNFQVQSKAWLGITDGRKNSNELIDSVYSILGFDHVATSDYQKINYHNSGNSAFIPTYEHGYNIFKTHQVCIDAEEVLWVDLMFGQTLSMKQWVLDQLGKQSRLVILAHPLLRNGYSINDMKYLTNYNGIEVLNNVRVSVDHWDEALSSGQIAYIVGNDDAHDVMNSNHVGRRFTMINSPDLSKDNIMRNLEKGAAYGMDFFRIDDEPMDRKVLRSKVIPKLLSAELVADTFFVSVDTKASSFRFIGNHGELKHKVSNTKNAQYKIGADEPYLRTEIEFSDGSIIYLNPIIRYNEDVPKTMKSAVVDSKATLRLRIIYFLIALSLAYLISRIRNRKKRNMIHD